MFWRISPRDVDRAVPPMPQWGMEVTPLGALYEDRGDRGFPDFNDLDSEDAKGSWRTNCRDRNLMDARRILVPLDGSEAAEAALPFALDLAETSKGQLLILRVTDVPFDRDPAPVERVLTRIREAEAYLRGISERLRVGGGQLTTSLWQGSPAAAIVRAVPYYRIDVIVMTSHGRSGREKEMFGSVAEAVVRGVTVPVHLVRPTGVVVQTPPGEGAPWPTGP